MTTIGRMGVLVSALALALGSAACGNDAEAETPSEVIVTSQAGLYQATLVTSPAVGHNSILLQLANADGSALEGAKVTSDVWCPSHGHGSGDLPMVSEHGHGSYLIDNVVFWMAGEWDVHVYVSAPAGYDELSGSFQVK